MTHIVVCGAIASGKTTLAQLFDDKGYDVVLENFRANPFWELFYFDTIQYAFETEITFLLQHFVQCRDANVSNGMVISDFSILQDLAYADVNLIGSKYQTFKAVYDEVSSSLPSPDLILNLVCGEKEELARIRARERDEESGVSIDYLKKLNEAVAARIEETRSSTKVVDIDTEAYNFANDPNDQQKVVDMVRAAMD